MKKMSTLTEQDVYELYQQYLGRPPESDDMIQHHLRAHQNRRQMCLYLSNSAEYQQRKRDLEASLSRPDEHASHHWRQWTDTPKLTAATGVTPLRFQEYLASRLSPPMRILSMLMPEEQALLYGVARENFRGEGLIIDAGPLLGLSTYMLASGLRDSANLQLEYRPYIYSFDLFRNERDYAAYFNSLERSCVTSNLLHEFIKLNSEFMPFIAPHQGDFLNWVWKNKANIEILFLDLAKSWALNQHAIHSFFPGPYSRQSNCNSARLCSLQ